MKVIKTLKLEDKGQDFLKLDILENGIINGSSIIFSNNRIRLLGIGRLDGSCYYSFQELIEDNFCYQLKDLHVYIWTGKGKKPLPWKAKTLNYKIKSK